MKILVLDNYDSFTFNIVQLLGAMKKVNLTVVRSGETSLTRIIKMHPDKILISPGPGKPEDAHLSLQVINNLGNNTPILGVCLGHQAIAVAFGGKVIQSKEPVHGKTNIITNSGEGVFNNLPKKFNVMRYHSLFVERKSLPEMLEVTATNDEGIIMGLRHNRLPIEGVQFHPESVLSEYGKKLFSNWVNN